MNNTATPIIRMNKTDHRNVSISTFCNDVVRGLTTLPKHLDSKYFYDAIGDKLFQDLMDCPEYYPTKCELDIFQNQTEALVKAIIGDSNDAFDLIELGAGNATKSSYLLSSLVKQGADFTFLPIDISAHVIDLLDIKLSKNIPGLNFRGLNGEYFDMLQKAANQSNRRKVVLFLGSNIGNMTLTEAEIFCFQLRESLSPGDMAIIGFDLKKNPKIILAAYNDAEGITKNFNLNLLCRINRELDADFDLEQFDHFPTYDPETGTCKSYLISLEDQEVNIKACDKIVSFHKDEFILMEISQKFTIQQTKDMAISTGFNPVNYLFDSKQWFTDAIWVVR